MDKCVLITAKVITIYNLFLLLWGIGDKRGITELKVHKVYKVHVKRERTFGNYLREGIEKKNSNF